MFPLGVRFSWVQDGFHVTLNLAASSCSDARAIWIWSGHVRVRTDTCMHYRGEVVSTGCFAWLESHLAAFKSLARFDVCVLKMAEKWKYLSWQRGEEVEDFSTRVRVSRGMEYLARGFCLRSLHLTWTWFGASDIIILYCCSFISFRSCMQTTLLFKHNWLVSGTMSLIHQSSRRRSTNNSKKKNKKK